MNDLDKAIATARTFQLKMVIAFILECFWGFTMAFAGATLAKSGMGADFTYPFLITYAIGAAGIFFWVIFPHRWKSVLLLCALAELALIWQ